MNEIEGTVGYRLVIGTNGRVASCELTRPSGNKALDDATCRLIASRARFEAATDETGAKVMGTYTGSVRWEIPD
jgi:protein TonB